MTAIAILGEYTPAFAPHAATSAAIGHAPARLGVSVDAAWVSTAAVDERLFKRFDALRVAPGSPCKNLEATPWAIGRAREGGMRQTRSTPERPHPPVCAFVVAALACTKVRNA
jgi:CTP synthase (UTP-ammonia lyase)